jgi:pimeloyl-ACP methyl ester carboxylesterase
MKRVLLRSLFWIFVARQLIRRQLLQWFASLCSFSHLLPNKPIDSVPESWDAQKRSMYELAEFGDGIRSEMVVGDDWRQHLFPNCTPTQMLEQLWTATGRTSATPGQMSMEQLVEGVRRLLLFRYPEHPSQTLDYWSKQDCVDIVKSLTRECPGFCIADDGARPSCMPTLWKGAPYRKPSWMVDAMTWFHLLVKLSLNALGLKSQFAHTPSGRIHYFDSHPANAFASKTTVGTPLVLVHGMHTTGVCWAFVALLLAPKRRVIVPDLTDFDFAFSQSDRGVPQRTSTQIASQKEHVQMCSELVDELSIGQVDLVGHSYGGSIVLKLAHARPSLVRKLILLAPFAIGLNQMTDPLEAEFDRLSGFARRALGYFVLPLVAAPQDLHIFSGIDRHEMVSTPTGSHVPTMIIWGDHDSICRPLGAGEEGAAQLMRPFGDSAEGWWIAGADHCLTIDSATAVVRLIEHFSADARTAVGATETQKEIGPTSMLLRLLQAMLWFTDKRTRRISSPAGGASTSSSTHECEQAGK